MEGAEDAYTYDSLALAARAATSVVLGRFTSFEPGTGAAPVDGVLVVDELIDGTDVSPSVRVQIYQGLPGIFGADPGGPVVVLLHERDDFAGQYIPLNRDAIWTEVDNALVSAMDGLRTVSAGPFADELGDIDTLVELTRWLRLNAAPPPNPLPDSDAVPSIDEQLGIALSEAKANPGSTVICVVLGNPNRADGITDVAGIVHVDPVDPRLPIGDADALCAQEWPGSSSYPVDD